MEEWLAVTRSLAMVIEWVQMVAVVRSFIMVDGINLKPYFGSIAVMILNIFNFLLNLL